MFNFVVKIFYFQEGKCGKKITRLRTSLDTVHCKMCHWTPRCNLTHILYVYSISTSVAIEYVLSATQSFLLKQSAARSQHPPKQSSRREDNSTGSVGGHNPDVLLGYLRAGITSTLACIYFKRYFVSHNKPYATQGNALPQIGGSSTPVFYLSLGKK